MFIDNGKSFFHIKKETVKKATFVAEDLDKPKKAIDLFGVKFSKESKEQNVKFGNQYFILRKTTVIF